MRKSWFAIGCALPLLAVSCLPGQTPSSDLEFEVASVKPSELITPAMIQSGKIHVGMKVDGARVDIGNFSLLQLIMKAYDVKSYQVQGPSWMMSLATAQRFDVVANLPSGATKEQVPEMLQKLLADRFKLVIHKDAGDRKVYALVVAKTGLKVKETETAPAGENAPNPAISGSNSVTITQNKGGGAEVSTGTGTRQKMTPSADGKSIRFEITKATMGQLAEGLTPMVDRPIVDMTELKGDYDVSFEISREELLNLARQQGANVPAAAPASNAPADAASDPTGSIFTAIQSMGLKLEPRKAPLTMIVVDKAEKMPTEN